MACSLHFPSLMPVLHNINLYFQEPDVSQLDFVRDLLAYFSEPKVWGMMQVAYEQLGLPYPSSVWSGCIEIIFDTMTPEQAQALLKVYHNGKLEDVMNKVSCVLSHDLLSAYLHSCVCGATVLNSSQQTLAVFYVVVSWPCLPSII